MTVAATRAIVPELGFTHQASSWAAAWSWPIWKKMSMKSSIWMPVYSGLASSRIPLGATCVTGRHDLAEGAWRPTTCSLLPSCSRPSTHPTLAHPPPIFDPTFFLGPPPFARGPAPPCQWHRKSYPSFERFFLPHLALFEIRAINHNP